MKTLEKVSDFVGKYMAAIVIVVAAGALFFPGPFSVVKTSWVNTLLGIVMFGMGLTLKPNDFKVVFSRPKDVIVGCVAQFTLMPFLAWVLTMVFHLPTELAIGVILVGTCPGGTSSNVMTYLSKGDVALSVGMTAVSTVLAPVLTPLLTLLYAGQRVDVNPVNMFLSIVKVVLVPIALGFVVNHFFHSFTENAVRVLPLVSTTAIVLIICAVVSANSAKIMTSGLLILVVVVLHNLLGYLTGYAVGKALKLDSTSGNFIKLGESNLTMNAPNFWYRTAKGGTWTKVTGSSWTRPDDAVYFEITTDDPAATHYTVTFDLNGGTSWGTNDSWISQIGGRWNDSHDQVSFTTQTGDKGECLNVPLMEGMAPERKDYKFVGWYTAAVGGEPVEEQTYFESEQQLERITENITLYVHWQWNGEGPEPDPVPVPDETVVDGGDGSGFGAVLAVAGGAAVVGAAGFGIYELATRAILKDLLPEGTVIPATRGDLALLLWQNAGRPEPAALPAFADTADAETAKAAQWCTEQGLLTAEDGAFHPEQKVTKYRVIRIWKQAAAPQQ